MRRNRVLEPVLAMTDTKPNPQSGGGNAFMPHRSVLVLGDDPALRTAVRLNLEGEGVRVFEASPSAEGWYPPDPSLRSGRPDVCILDLHVPTAVEWTKLPAVRKWDALQDVPVLVMADEPPDPGLGADYRPDAHLMKPFHADDLVRNVQRLLRTRGKG
jgi:DNA-binding response OmpR family regulator